MGRGHGLLVRADGPSAAAEAAGVGVVVAAGATASSLSTEGGVELRLTTIV